MGGHGRFGFLKDPCTAPNGTVNLVCGASRKRKREKATPNTKEKSEKKPRRNNRPIVTMLLHHQKNSYRVKALLDTGCSINLINQQTVERLNLPKHPHKNPRITKISPDKLSKARHNSIRGWYDYNTGSISLKKLSKSLQWRKESTYFSRSAGWRITHPRELGQRRK